MSVLAVAVATALLIGVRHEPALKAWAMSPRTPRRIAYNLLAGTGAAAAAISITGILVAVIVGTVGTVAGTL